MINEITLLHMVVLIWCCVFSRLFSQKILILNTDTSVFFIYWYWYCFSIFHIEYWNWYFSILKAYWILVLLFCTGQCSGVFAIEILGVNLNIQQKIAKILTQSTPIDSKTICTTLCWMLRIMKVSATETPLLCCCFQNDGPKYFINQI